MEVIPKLYILSFGNPAAAYSIALFIDCYGLGHECPPRPMCHRLSHQVALLEGGGTLRRRGPGAAAEVTASRPEGI